MSKQKNHRYLLGLLLRPRWRVTARTLGVAVAFSLGLVAYVLLNPKRPLAMPPFWLVFSMVLTLSFTVGWFRMRAGAAQYLLALQAPTPDALVAHIQRLMRSASVADADAFLAQATALAYVLYGRGAEANAALATVDWQTRAPYIQSVGLGAQSFIALVCDQDVTRGLSLAQRAQTQGELGRFVPGSGAARHFQGVNLALAEALAGIDTPQTHAMLRASIDPKRYPMVQMFGRVGLAVVAQHEGQAAAVSEHRRALAALAPHFDALLFSQVA